MSMINKKPLAHMATCEETMALQNLIVVKPSALQLDEI